jgi:uncharacterized protein
VIRKSLLSVLLAASAGAAFAAPPSTESIERLMAITKTEALFDGIYNDMEPYLRKTMQDATPGKMTEAQKKTIDDLAPRMAELVRQEFNWTTLKPAYIRIYQETLDQSEVDGLLAFYESPVGQSTITKMPLIMQRSMALTQDQLRVLMPKWNRLIQETVKKAVATR